MISKEEVHNLAALARLDLSEVEVEGLQKDISNILEYVGQVSAISVDTDKGSDLTPGLSKTLPLTQPDNVLRVDAARDAGDTMAGKEERVKDAFPKREGNYNVVRKIIQKDE